MRPQTPSKTASSLPGRSGRPPLSLKLLFSFTFVSIRSPVPPTSLTWGSALVYPAPSAASSLANPYPSAPPVGGHPGSPRLSTELGTPRALPCGRTPGRPLSGKRNHQAQPGPPNGRTPSLKLYAPPTPRAAGAPPLGEAQARATAHGRSALT